MSYVSFVAHITIINNSPFDVTFFYLDGIQLPLVLSDVEGFFLLI